MRPLLAVAIIWGLMAAAAAAQTYSPQRPLPRTTSMPALRALATQREVEERFKLGIDAEARGDWTSAVAEFNRIVALNPPEPKGSTARYDLAIAYANLARYDDAATELRAAIALDPAFLAAMANLVCRRYSSRRSRTSTPGRRSLCSVRSGLGARALLSRHRRAARAAMPPPLAKTSESFFATTRPMPSHITISLWPRNVWAATTPRNASCVPLFRSRRLTHARDSRSASFCCGKESTARQETSSSKRRVDAAGDPALQNIAAAARDSIPVP